MTLSRMAEVEADAALAALQQSFAGVKQVRHRDTSLMRNSTPSGPCSRTLPKRNSIPP